MKKNVCCFVGHRLIDESEELKKGLWESIETLIVSEKVDTFLFGSGSRFDELCYNDYIDVEIGQSLISTANSKNSQTITNGN